jgi:hypothetical protein
MVSSLDAVLASSSSMWHRCTQFGPALAAATVVLHTF